MAIRIERLSSCTGVLLSVIVVLLMPVGVAAQETIVPLQLSFSDPGARSMGFGGAFVALADDATAAFANPAGLVQLLRPEVSVEGRHWSNSTPYAVTGRAEGLPTGNGLDSTVGLRSATSEYDVTGLSFLSVAFPLGDLSLAFFRHEYANLEFFSETQGIYGGGTDCCQVRLWDQRATTDLDIVSYGFSAAYPISDRFSVGLGAIYYDASLVSQATDFLWDEDTVASFYGPNSYFPENSHVTQKLSFDGIDFTLAGGFLWKPSESIRIGGVYRQGLEADIGTEATAGEAIDLGVPPGGLLFRASGIPVDFPDIYGLGFAYRGPDGRLTLSFQWDHVEYSDIPRSLFLDDQTIDDANELHLGAEYVFLGSTPIIALRLGTWLEPDHQMRATNNDDPFFRALLQPGEDEMHYAAGLGVAMQHFQIDLALDFADRVDTVSLSAIYNF